jgi:hypothetical protein
VFDERDEENKSPEDLGPEKAYLMQKLTEFKDQAHSDFAARKATYESLKTSLPAGLDLYFKAMEPKLIEEFKPANEMITRFETALNEEKEGDLGAWKWLVDYAGSQYDIQNVLF